MTQTDEDILQPTAEAISSVPEPNASNPACHVNQDDSDSGNHGDNDDDALDEIDSDLLKYLSKRMSVITKERNTSREGNQALKDENVELRASNAKLEESIHRLRAQLDQAEARLRTSETDHESAVETLSQQVAQFEQRARATENDLKSVRLELIGVQRSMYRAQLQLKNYALQSLRRNFGAYIAEALTSRPADSQHYKMTSSMPARGPNRVYHPEFKEAEGQGRFVMHRGKVAWLQIWLQKPW